MTREKFHQELREIQAAVIALGEPVEQSLAEAVQALRQGDSMPALAVIGGNAAAQAAQREIENRCLDVIRLQAPVARDLREVVVSQRVAFALERIGDHAVRMARRVVDMEKLEHPALPLSLETLARTVRAHVHGSLQALAARDVQQAADLLANHEALEGQYRRCLHELQEQMAQDANNVGAYTLLLLAADELERIGELVAVICEQVLYLVEGEIPLLSRV